jgi:hypothetical protein
LDYGKINMVCTCCQLEYTKTQKEFPARKWTKADISNFFYKGYSFGMCDICLKLPESELPKF